MEWLGVKQIELRVNVASLECAAAGTFWYGFGGFSWSHSETVRRMR